MTRTIVCLLASVSLLVASQASAMTVLKAPLADLVKTSELVLHGTVSKVEVLDLRRQNKGVWTEYSLKVVEVIKGDKRVGKIFKWRLVGGSTKDGMTLEVPGMPTFISGEETVVLLERHSTGHTLTGAPQGKYHVFSDNKGQKMVRRDLESAHIVTKDPHGGRLVAAHGHGKLMSSATGYQTLAALRTELKGYVKAQLANAKSSKRAVPMPRRARAKR